MPVIRVIEFEDYAVNIGDFSLTKSDCNVSPLDVTFDVNASFTNGEYIELDSNNLPSRCPANSEIMSEIRKRHVNLKSIDLTSLDECMNHAPLFNKILSDQLSDTDIKRFYVKLAEYLLEISDDKLEFNGEACTGKSIVSYVIQLLTGRKMSTSNGPVKEKDHVTVFSFNTPVDFKGNFKANVINPYLIYANELGFIACTAVHMYNEYGHLEEYKY